MARTGSAALFEEAGSDLLFLGRDLRRRAHRRAGGRFGAVAGEAQIDAAGAPEADALGFAGGGAKLDEGVGGLRLIVFGRAHLYVLRSGGGSRPWPDPVGSAWALYPPAA